MLVLSVYLKCIFEFGFFVLRSWSIFFVVWSILLIKVNDVYFINIVVGGYMYCVFFVCSFFFGNILLNDLDYKI